MAARRAVVVEWAADLVALKRQIDEVGEVRNLDPDLILLCDQPQLQAWQLLHSPRVTLLALAKSAAAPSAFPRRPAAIAACARARARLDSVELRPRVLGVAPAAAELQIDLHRHFELDRLAAQLCDALRHAPARTRSNRGSRASAGAGRSPRASRRASTASCAARPIPESGRSWPCGSRPAGFRGDTKDGWGRRCGARPLRANTDLALWSRQLPAPPNGPNAGAHRRRARCSPVAPRCFGRVRRAGTRTAARDRTWCRSRAPRFSVLPIIAANLRTPAPNALAKLVFFADCRSSPVQSETSWWKSVSGSLR